MIMKMVELKNMMEMIILNRKLKMIGN